MATKFVKQYGYYRCGTNFTQVLLERNFDCKVMINQLGCKHDPPKNWRRWLKNSDKPVPEGLAEAVANNEVPVIVTVKDPYGWADSFMLYWRKRKRHHNEVTPAFMKQRVAKFNKGYRQWSQMNKLRIVVKYEDLLSDYEGTVRRIGERLKLTLLHDPPQRVEKRVDPHPHLRGRPLDPSYFLERRYLKNLPAKYKQIVTRNVDWKLFRRWGYKPL